MIDKNNLVSEKVIFWQKYNKYLVSITLTICIAFLLFFSSPVSAIDLSLQPDNLSSYNNESITFFGKIEIETDEFIPVKNITFFIPISQITCTFYPNGTKISGCDGIIILPNQAYSEELGELVSYNPEGEYGYGLGFQDDLDYNISFIPIELNLSVNDYSAYLEISTGISDITGLQTLFNVKPYSEEHSQSSGGAIISLIGEDNSSANQTEVINLPEHVHQLNNLETGCIICGALGGLGLAGYLVRKASLVAMLG